MSINLLSPSSLEIYQGMVTSSFFFSQAEEATSESIFSRIFHSSILYQQCSLISVAIAKQALSLHWSLLCLSPCVLPFFPSLDPISSYWNRAHEVAILVTMIALGYLGRIAFVTTAALWGTFIFLGKTRIISKSFTQKIEQIAVLFSSALLFYQGNTTTRLFTAVAVAAFFGKKMLSSQPEMKKEYEFTTEMKRAFQTLPDFSAFYTEALFSPSKLEEAENSIGNKIGPSDVTLSLKQKTHLWLRHLLVKELIEKMGDVKETLKREEEEEFWKVALTEAALIPEEKGIREETMSENLRIKAQPLLNSFMKHLLILLNDQEFSLRSEKELKKRFAETPPRLRKAMRFSARFT